MQIAFEASSPPVGESAAAAAGMPARTSSIAIGRPMMPVDATRISPGSQPSCAAVSSAISRASASPCAPVQAFALPELTTVARAVPPRTTVRLSVTGAATTVFCVNMPATLAGVSDTISARSGLPDSLSPQAMPDARKPSREGDGLHAPSPSAVSPRPSSRPSIRFAFCSA